MKFIIDKQAFATQLSDVSRAVSTKSAIPVLTGIKITATEEGITLIGSDAEISIESFLSLDNESYNLTIEKTGSVVVTARLFNDIIRKLPTDTVTITVNEQYLVTIESGKAIFTLNGVDGSAYPHLPVIDVERRIQLPTVLFKNLINQTIISTSTQETRPVLTGINITAFDGYLVGVATDSHRLSQREIPIGTSKDKLGFDSMTIPKKTVQELTRIVEDNQDIYMMVMEQQVIFIIDNITIYSRLLEGNYPETSRLIPSSYSSEIVVNAEEFLYSIDRAALMAHQGKNNAVQLNIESGLVELLVHGNERGKVSEEIKCEEVKGEDLTISFNPDYMKDALGTFGPIAIKIQFQSAVRPLLLSAVESGEEEHNDLLQLLTPIRTH